MIDIIVMLIAPPRHLGPDRLGGRDTRPADS
jgi:hypothetical protein